MTSRVTYSNSAGCFPALTTYLRSLVKTFAKTHDILYSTNNNSKKKMHKTCVCGGPWGCGEVVIDINVDFLFKQVIMEQYF